MMEKLVAYLAFTFLWVLIIVGACLTPQLHILDDWRPPETLADYFVGALVLAVIIGVPGTTVFTAFTDAQPKMPEAKLAPQEHGPARVKDWGAWDEQGVAVDVDVLS
jgi:hypothetical protein